MARRSCPVPGPGATRPGWHVGFAASVVGPLSRMVSRQAAHPQGALGRLMARNWIRETAAVNDTAIDLLRPTAGRRIVEIGFGPGRTLGRLADTGAVVTGVETSAAMLATAARRNAGHIAAGRVNLHQGDGITLPNGDESVDAVLGVHSLYFWPDPAATLVDVDRTLRPGGRLVLAFHAGEHPLPARFAPDVYRVPTTGQATQWLRAAGFTDIHVEHRPDVAATVVWLVATKAGR